jgi:glutamyl-tRNA synthetase
MNTPAVRVRFAPSPTGAFHVGGARTALFNYLFARHHGGKFILRIEDTDRKRYVPEALSWLLDGLRYLNLEWDEGPDVGGDYGPYTQSQRLDLYHHHARELIDNGKAYYCFCTPERLQKLAEEQRRLKLDPGYDRKCRRLDPDQAVERAAAGEPHTIRFKAPVEGGVTIVDVIRGTITFQNSALHDSVLLKSDGMPTYHLAVVVDDHLMKVSHILRGEEWISSLPLHIHLYRAFGWKPPVMAHLPLILNPSGKGKMSKREQRSADGQLLPVFVQSFQKLGYLPEAMVNYLALLGWSRDDQTEIMSREELINFFSLDRVHASPAAWDYEKLRHLNGYYIRQLSLERLTELLYPYVREAGFSADVSRLRQIVPLIRERIEILSEAVEKIDFFLLDELPEYPLEWLIPKHGDLQLTSRVLNRARQTLAQVEFNHVQIETGLRTDAQELGLKAGQMFLPIRVAVCGRKVAPPLFQTLEVLGRSVSLKRIDQALSKINAAIKD